MLERHLSERNSDKTPEPKGEVKPRANGKSVYVIQKHAATTLHYDLRLEMDGVLKSWTIPKEPSMKENIKRLAVRTEDHPLAYADFEGEIPVGEYGAGKVEIWDKGNYEPKEIKEGKIIINIKGLKLRGEYCLIKTKLKGKESWLFFKRSQNKEK